ncbi:MAG: hypothetical protein MUW56_12690 [Chryseobacterium sp.]|uniref:hypothetical protein n=1 Tax=Chryseobacterium sp. TaxID=1871047 RepID=UPI0025BD1714|nr:hypothetical protein [Chryseobacterium sp.]MCJ7934461.1 hypothetical protein [Chryseobacterium sp.]
MKGFNFLIFLSIIIFITGCKKEKDKTTDDGNTTFSAKVADTIKYSAEAKGNKLTGIIKLHKKAGPKIFTADQLDNYLAGEFIYHAERGTLMKLGKSTGEKKYLDTYDIPVSTFQILYDHKPDESVGLKLYFVELDKNYGLINVPPHYRNFLYMIAVPVDTDGDPVGSNNKYVVFNLSKDFDINTSTIKDDEYERLIKYFSGNNSEIYSSLKSYYSRKGKGNTSSIFYSWGDVRDNINKFCHNNKYDSIKFKLAEIIGINSIKYYIDKHPELELDEDKYKLAYSSREKQLTIVGEFYLTKNVNGIKQAMSSDKYFDMGSLYP